MSQKGQVMNPDGRPRKGTEKADRVVLTFPPGLAAAIKARAAAERRPITWVAREALIQYLARESERSQVSNH